jgi:hypothetical protein
MFGSSGNRVGNLKLIGGGKALVSRARIDFPQGQKLVTMH